MRMVGMGPIEDIKFRISWPNLDPRGEVRFTVTASSRKHRFSLGPYEAARSLQTYLEIQWRAFPEVSVLKTQGDCVDICFPTGPWDRMTSPDPHSEGEYIREIQARLVKLVNNWSGKRCEVTFPTGEYRGR
jgi:hypothetical protein